MFRFRRYRVYVIFAIIAIGALYHFTTIDGLEGAGAASVERLKQFGPKFDSTAAAKSKDLPDKDSTTGNDGENSLARPSRIGNSDKEVETSSAAEKDSLRLKDQQKESSSKTVLAANVKSTSAADKVASSTEIEGFRKDGASTRKASAAAEATAAGNNPKGSPTAVSKTTKSGTATADGPADPIVNPHGGDGRYEVIGATDKPKIHWTQLPDHFPVPTDKLIQLPTGKPKPIPKVQYDFKKEGQADEKKLDAIRKVFSFSWSGYRKNAWMQDELSPMTGKYRNPFNTWGATLVDTLDTLWMLDLKEEFEEAVEAVGKIDFTTSPRNDIPLFETVIRYLGGLVAAYDISGEKHKVLLDKAVELADILMGAFDTPNRMPMTYYLWKPTFASQPHRAKTRVVLAELGSLSLEFTRLAQITKEARYYDAIARITNELEALQPDTKVPGLWPQELDASGCKKSDMLSTSTLQSSSLQQEKPLLAADKENAASNPDLLDGGPAKSAEGKEKGDGAESKGTASKSTLNKRDTQRDGSVTPNTSSEPPLKKPDCEPQGLTSPPHSDLEKFTMGGQADSTYEYLPKEYLLLGGLEEKYRKMYEMAANATRENLLYRPMIPDEDRGVLLSGLLHSRGPHDKPDDRHNLTPEGTHLACFVGGMFALGSKIFKIPSDMDLAKRLTDGCVWAYEQTNTGIMPEGYEGIACKSMDSCPWNQTLWEATLDPYAATREQNRIDRDKKVREQKDRKAQRTKEIQAANEKAHTVDSDSDTSDHKQSEGKSSTSKSDKETESVSEKGSTGASDKEVKSTADKDAETSQAKNQKKSTDKETKTGFEKETKSSQGKDTEKESKGVSQSSLHDSSDATTSDLPMGKATSDKASGVEALKKRQLGEVDDSSSSGDNSPGIRNKGASTSSKSTSSESKASPKSTKDDEESETNPTGNAPDPLKAADKEALSEASKTTSDPATKEAEESVPAKAAPAPPEVSQADSIADEYEPPPIPTREEFVADKVKNERLPLGMVRIWERKYILRPEAIESVFIMWRATGDKYWREKGWKMFEAIEKHTATTYGASAIRDVTAEKGSPMDEMESFWLAETLKYFYLLFSEPGLVSLDDYVLNTEAHPFKRPKP